MSTGALTRRILHNDLRLFWRGNAGKKGAWATSTLGRIGILALLHLVVWGMLAGRDAETRTVGGPELTCLVALLILAMTALHRSLEVLYNRGDLSLLLASPVPARVVLRTRLVDITLTSLLGTMLLLLPLLDVSIALFGWQWAWGFVAWIAATLLVVPTAVLTTLTAVERIGVRRARTVVQALGILIGMLGVVATQLPTWLASAPSRTERRLERDGMRADLFAWFDVPPLRQLADAAQGAWQYLLPMVVGGVALFALCQRALALRFTQGAQGAAADVGGGAQRSATTAGAAWRGAFVRPRWRVLLRSQLLLLRRDPLLLMRCAMQIVSIVPMLFGAMMLHRTAGVGGVGLLAAAIVPITLAAMLNAGDEAHEFVASSPLRPRERARARAAAAAAPLVLFAWVMAIVVVAMASPLAAAMVVLGGTLNAFGSAWLGTCSTRAHTTEERGRNRPPKVAWQTFVCIGIAAVGTVGLGVADSGHPWIGTAVFAVGALFASLLFRAAPRPAVYDS